MVGINVHKNYNDVMNQRVTDLRSQARVENWIQDKIQKEITRLQSDIKNELRKGKLKCH